MRRSSSRSSTALGAASGVAAACVALGVAELVAGFSAAWRSPVIDVGDRVVDNVPPPVKGLAISLFGTADKVALLVGIGVLLVVYAAVIGALAFRRRLAIGLVGIAAFGVIGSHVSAVGHRRRWTDVGGDLPARRRRHRPRPVRRGRAR